MGTWITDLEAIKSITEQNEDDNLSFRNFIRNSDRWSGRKLDDLVHEILGEVTAEIDCKTCANCCISMSCDVDADDITRLAKRLDMTPDEFTDRHCTENGFHEQLISQIPCPFLDERTCTVYEDRPKNCRDFPHLHKKEIRSRMFALIENAEQCPIVFNVLEEMKRRMNWRRRG